MAKLVLSPNSPLLLVPQATAIPSNGGRVVEVVVVEELLEILVEQVLELLVVVKYSTKPVLNWSPPLETSTKV